MFKSIFIILSAVVFNHNSFSQEAVKKVVDNVKDKQIVLYTSLMPMEKKEKIKIKPIKLPRQKR